MELNSMLKDSVALQDENGNLGRCRVVLEDITERKKAEDALRENEHLFRSIFQKHEAVMLLIEPESGQILEANQAAARFYGYQIPELLRMSIQQINTLSPDEVARERKKALLQERNYFIFKHRLAAGEVRTVEVHSSPIDYGGRQILFSIIHDITERKKAEEALKQKIEELERFNSTMVGRELRMIELKKEINRLLQKAGQQEKYGIVE